METEKQRPNCTYAPERGCMWPFGCEHCGFDRDEAERRKKLPLEEGPRGLWRKVIRKREGD